jgi:hypothetical protein
LRIGIRIGVGVAIGINRDANNGGAIHAAVNGPIRSVSIPAATMSSVMSVIVVMPMTVVRTGGHRG